MPARPRPTALCYAAITPLAIAALVPLALVPSASCTFPTVDYTDAGASTETGTPACTISNRCANFAQQCVADVTKNYNSCSHACSKADQNMNACLDMCSATRTTKLGQCEPLCEGCAHKDGCGNATASCSSLVGG
jgi:hypothetical protein